MRKLMTAAALVVAVGLVAQTAAAQTAGAAKPFSFGVQASFMTQSVGLGVGARAVYSGLGTTLNVPGLAAYGAFDYFFPGSSYGVSPKYWEINAGATYDIPVASLPSITPYVGAGINYAHTSVSVSGFEASASKTGLNILGGGRFKVGQSLNAFAEARLELGGGGAFAATVGVLF
jgi:hypothetical protein